jgi:uncharacterized membrane protein YhiD involved in acid resistance
MLLRIALAMVMGLCIGWNRETQNKAAGLRTMTLVAMGAAGRAWHRANQGAGARTVAGIAEVLASSSG